jgi:hypothetical protein
MKSLVISLLVAFFLFSSQGMAQTSQVSRKEYLALKKRVETLEAMVFKQSTWSCSAYCEFDWIYGSVVDTIQESLAIEGVSAADAFTNLNAACKNVVQEYSRPGRLYGAAVIKTDRHSVATAANACSQN